MNTQKLKDNLSKFEAKADRLLIKAAGCSYTVGILAAVLVALIVLVVLW